MTCLWRIGLDRVRAASASAGDFHHATASVTLEWKDAGDLLPENDHPERRMLCRNHRINCGPHGDGQSTHVESPAPCSSGRWLRVLTIFDAALFRRIEGFCARGTLGVCLLATWADR